MALFDSFPEFVKSPTTQTTFHSAFPPLKVDKRYRGVYERAGFEIFKRESPNSSNSSSRSVSSPNPSPRIASSPSVSRTNTSQEQIQTPTSLRNVSASKLGEPSKPGPHGQSQGYLSQGLDQTHSDNPTPRSQPSGSRSISSSYRRTKQVSSPNPHNNNLLAVSGSASPSPSPISGVFPNTQETLPETSLFNAAREDRSNLSASTMDSVPATQSQRSQFNPYSRSKAQPPGHAEKNVKELKIHVPQNSQGSSNTGSTGNVWQTSSVSSASSSPDHSKHQHYTGVSSSTGITEADDFEAKPSEHTFDGEYSAHEITQRLMNDTFFKDGVADETIYDGDFPASLPADQRTLQGMGRGMSKRSKEAGDPYPSTAPYPVSDIAVGAIPPPAERSMFYGISASVTKTNEQDNISRPNAPIEERSPSDTGSMVEQQFRNFQKETDLNAHLDMLKSELYQNKKPLAEPAADHRPSYLTVDNLEPAHTRMDQTNRVSAFSMVSSILSKSDNENEFESGDYKRKTMPGLFEGKHFSQGAEGDDGNMFSAFKAPPLPAVLVESNDKGEVKVPYPAAFNTALMPLPEDFTPKASLPDTAMVSEDLATSAPVAEGIYSSEEPGLQNVRSHNDAPSFNNSDPEFSIVEPRNIPSFSVDNAANLKTMDHEFLRQPLYPPTQPQGVLTGGDVHSPDSKLPSTSIHAKHQSDATERSSLGSGAPPIPSAMSVDAFGESFENSLEDPYQNLADTTFGTSCSFDFDVPVKPLSFGKSRNNSTSTANSHRNVLDLGNASDSGNASHGEPYAHSEYGKTATQDNGEYRSREEQRVDYDPSYDTQPYEDFFQEVHGDHREHKDGYKVEARDNSYSDPYRDVPQFKDNVYNNIYNNDYNTQNTCNDDYNLSFNSTLADVDIPPRRTIGDRDQAVELGMEAAGEKYPSGQGPCRKCKQVIERKPIYSTTGELSGQWHRGCFSCYECGLKFNKTIAVYVFGDKPYCHQHYHVLNHSLCTVCHQGVEGECIKNEINDVFHLHCLTCMCCDKHIDADYYVIDNAIWCEEDAQAEIQRLKMQQSVSKLEKRRTQLFYI